MTKAGFVMNMVAVVLITLFCWFLLAVVDEAMSIYYAQFNARFFITLIVRYSFSFASYTSISVYFTVIFFLARLAGFLASSSDPSKN